MTALTCTVSYLWYFGSIYTPFLNGVRLLYPVLVLFLYFPAMFNSRIMFASIISLSAIGMILYMGTLYAGYPVI